MIELQLDIFSAPPKQPVPSFQVDTERLALWQKIESYRDTMQKQTTIRRGSLHLWAVSQADDVMSDVLLSMQSFKDSLVGPHRTRNLNFCADVLERELLARPNGKGREGQHFAPRK